MQAPVVPTFPLALRLSRKFRSVTFPSWAEVNSAFVIPSVSDEINALLPLDQPKWNENIAQAYEKSFSDEELSSLASEGRSSKYASKVLAQQGVIGKQMESTSKPILADLVTQALRTVMSKTP